MVSPAHQRILSRFLSPWARCPSYSEEVEGGSPAPPPRLLRRQSGLRGQPGVPSWPGAVLPAGSGGGALCLGVPPRAGGGQSREGQTARGIPVTEQEAELPGGTREGWARDATLPRLCPRKAPTPGHSGLPRWGPPWNSHLPLSVCPLTILMLRDGRASHQSVQPHYTCWVRLTAACRARRTGYLVPPWRVPDG